MALQSATVHLSLLARREFGRLAGFWVSPESAALHFAQLFPLPFKESAKEQRLDYLVAAMRNYSASTKLLASNLDSLFPEFQSPVFTTEALSLDIKTPHHFSGAVENFWKSVARCEPVENIKFSVNF